MKNIYEDPLTPEEYFKHFSLNDEKLQKYSQGKLRQCPFCGTTEHLTIVSTNENAYWVWCGYEDDEGCGVQMDSDNTPKKAIEKWNIRP